MRKRLANTFKATKFKDCEMVAVAARPGGAVDMSAGGPPPRRGRARRASDASGRGGARAALTGEFLFAVDHRFPIKGQERCSPGRC